MRNYLLAAFSILLSQFVYSQKPINTKSVVPPSPNVASLFKFLETPVSKFNGIPEVSVPVYTIKGKDIELPITLMYHAGGVRVTEASSWVGTSWALNAGGVITQSIRGVRDDTQKGRFNTTPLNPNSLDNPTACDLKTVNAGQYDSEPDIFSFNFNGKSGQFYLNDAKNVIQIPEQKLKIEFTSVNTPPLYTIAKWKITDVDGTQYLFEDVEQAISKTKGLRGAEIIGDEVGNFPQETQRSWMLTQIIQTSGEIISFTYETYNSLDYMFGSETQYFDNTPYTVPQSCPSQSLPNNYFAATKNFHMQSTWQGKRIQSIIFPGGKIEFIAGALRCDVWGDKFLDKIVVTNTNNQKIKELDFTYKYYVGNTVYTTAALNCSTDLAPDVESPGGGYHNYYKDRRLFLTSVDEVDATNVKIGSYTFDYENSIGLPDRFSAQQDWWGFYNGNQFTSLLQNVFKTSQLLDNMYRYDVHGRGPNLLYAKQGSLKKITYPTGGYTEFEFELNSLTTAYGPTYIVHPEVNYSASGQTSGTFLGNITVNDISGSAIIPFQVDKCVFGTTAHSFVGFYITDMNNTVIISGSQVNTALQTATNGEVSYTLNNGQYKIYSNAMATFPCAYNIKVKKWTDQPTLPDNKDNGGLRIKKITTYDPVSDKKIYKTYAYTELIGGKSLSTGVSSLPLSSIKIDYVFWKSICVLYQNVNNPEIPSGEVVAKFIALNSSTNYPLSSNQNGTIGYRKVTEKSIDGSGNDLGYTYYEFTSGGDALPSNVITFQGATTHYLSGNDIYPWAPVVNMSWLRGKPLKVQHFASTGVNTYKSIRSEIYNYYQEVFFDTTKAFSSSYSLAANITQGVGCPNGDLLRTGDALRYNTYRLFSGYQLLNSTTIDETDANNNVITTITAYEYNLNNLLPCKITTSNSVTGTNIQLIKYPKDYTTITATDAISAGVKALQTAYAINRPVEQTMQRVVNNVNIGTTGGVFNTYMAANLEPDKIFSAEITAPVTGFTTSGVAGGAVTKDTRYKERVSFNQYDAGNNLLEQQKVNDAKQSYIWDYNSNYPIAQVVGSAVTEIAYTSFEADGKGNWSYSGTPIADANVPPTGKKYFTIVGTANNITKSGLSATGTYIISYWKKSGTVAVNGTTPITGKTINGWTYYEHKVVSPASGLITVSGTGGVIDELRLYPSTAQMTTYTYDPLIGMTSQCDANNRITYYEYDNFQRLTLIRDQDKNIIKKICYNYAGQPDNCSGTITTYGNFTKSGTFNRSNCGYGGIGSNVTYTVAANTYTSTVSQAAADQLAQNDIDANGSTYANTNGICTYKSGEKSGTFTRNNCTGAATSGSVIYTVAANTYSSTVSQAAADQLAQNDVNANGQTYANTNGTCTYRNVSKSGSFTRNNCTGGATGSSVIYTVAANTYSSTVSQAAADQLAQNDVNTNGQAYANANGTCTASTTCSFTALTGFVVNSGTISKSGSTVNFTITFRSASGTATWGTLNAIANITGICIPGTTKVFQVSENGRTWQVVITVSGIFNVQLLSGTAPSGTNTVTLTGSYAP